MYYRILLFIFYTILRPLPCLTTLSTRQNLSCSRQSFQNDCPTLFGLYTSLTQTLRLPPLWLLRPHPDPSSDNTYLLSLTYPPTTLFFSTHTPPHPPPHTVVIVPD